MENPAIKLSSVIVRLFELSTESSLSKVNQKKALTNAIHLQGLFNVLAQRSFKKNTQKYTKALESVKKSSRKLKKAKKEAEKLADAIKQTTALIKSIENLVKIA